MHHAFVLKPVLCMPLYVFGHCHAGKHTRSLSHKTCVVGSRNPSRIRTCIQVFVKFSEKIESGVAPLDDRQAPCMSNLGLCFGRRSKTGLKFSLHQSKRRGAGWLTAGSEKGWKMNLWWGRGGSIGRASASRSNGFHDQRFESRPEHKKNL